jgi:hypothetical protein
LLYQGSAVPGLAEGSFASAFSVPSAFNQAFSPITGTGTVSTATEACSAACDREEDCVGYRLTYEVGGAPLKTTPTADSAYTCVGVTVLTNLPSFEHVYSYNRACLAVPTCGGVPDDSSCAPRRVFCGISALTATDCPATCKACTITTTQEVTTAEVPEDTEAPATTDDP